LLCLLLYGKINKNMVLEKELKTYNSLKNKLLEESRGKFALIKGQDLIGVFENRETALSEGYKRFGNEEFLVKEIIEVEAIHFFTRPLVL